jgi:hypothetical protein
MWRNIVVLAFQEPALPATREAGLKRPLKAKK